MTDIQMGSMVVQWLPLSNKVLGLILSGFEFACAFCVVQRQDRLTGDSELLV